MQNKQIRVLHLGLSPNRGGIETIVYSWWKHIDDEKVHFDFVNLYEEPIAFENEFILGGAQVFYIVARKKNPLKHIRALIKIFREKNYDYVHCHVMSLSEPEPVKICKKLQLKTKVIIHCHTAAKLENMTLKRKLLHIYGSFQLKKYNYLKLSCGYEAGRTMFNTSCFSVVENGIDIEKFKFSIEKRNRFRKKYGISPNAFVVGHVGRIDKVKNYPFLLETYSLIKQKNITSVLLLIGDIDGNDDIMKLIKKYGLESNTVFTGKISSTADCYSAMDVFLFPSLYEGISVSMIEAQASGLECIVSENISRESSVSDYVHFVSIDDPCVMADMVKQFFFDDPNIRFSRSIDPKYDIRRSTEKLIDYYIDNQE